MPASDKKPPLASPNAHTEDVYQLIPPDVPAIDPRFEKPVVPEIVSEDDDPPEPADASGVRFQFTLRDMLLLMTGFAVWLSTMSVLQWSWSLAAGLSGVAAFISLIVLTVAEPENPSVRFAWWCILAVYGLTCLGAIAIGQ